MNMSTGHQLKRYERQIAVDGFGREGQERLKRAKVFIAGAGGLGSVISIYLTAVGVGNIRLIDHDRVELSDLNRQILYGDKDVGRIKVAAAKEKLALLNPEVVVEAANETITADNITELVTGYDLIVDAMDNFSTRYILNKVAISNNIPFFHGAVCGFEGRATTIIPGKTPCLKCIYPRVPQHGVSPVVGVTTAVIGGIQATEVIKCVAGIGKLLLNKLLIYDGSSLEFTEIKLKRRLDCEECRYLKRNQR